MCGAPSISTTIRRLKSLAGTTSSDPPVDEPGSPGPGSTSSIPHPGASILPALAASRSKPEPLLHSGRASGCGRRDRAVEEQSAEQNEHRRHDRHAEEAEESGNRGPATAAKKPRAATIVTILPGISQRRSMSKPASSKKCSSCSSQTRGGGTPWSRVHEPSEMLDEESPPAQQSSRWPERGPTITRWQRGFFMVKFWRGPLGGSNGATYPLMGDQRSRVPQRESAGSSRARRRTSSRLSC